eukprot:g2326.t1
MLPGDEKGDLPPSSSSSRGNPSRSWRRRFEVKHVVKLLVLVDMFSVALVVPLLSSYFRDLNISTEQYGLLSSAYSLSQIVGGLVLGALSDRAMSRRSVLLISFLGSAVSYGTIGLSTSLSMLLMGRVVVGLVKQTMTISTAIVSENTNPENRSAELSKLTAAMTFAFIVGPATGSFLYQRSKKIPPLVAGFLFLVNSALNLILLPAGNDKAAVATSSAAASKKNDDENSNSSTSNDDGDGDDAWTVVAGDAAASERTTGGSGGEREKGEKVTSAPRPPCPSATSNFWANLKKACSDGPTLRILAAKLIYGFLMRALGTQNFVGYFEERFDIDSGALGYIASYTSGLSFVVQLYVVGRLTALISETSLVSCSLAVITLANLGEGTPSLFGLNGYLAVLVPARTVANAALGACLQSIFTQRVPQGDLGAALGVQNVLLSASGVVGPLYGGMFMGVLGVLARPTVNAAHYAAFFVLWWVMEARRGGGGTEEKKQRFDCWGEVGGKDEDSKKAD